MNQHFSDDDPAGKGGRSEDAHRSVPGADDIRAFGADWISIVIPDDASALEDDARALRREAAEQRRGQRWAAFGRMVTGRPERPRLIGAWGPVITVASVVTGLFICLTLVLPDAPRPPGRNPLATSGATAGELGGLMPAVELTDSTGTRHSLRDLRPAVLVLAPRGCDCTATETSVIDMTQASGVGVTLITGDDAATIPRNAPIDRVHAFADSKTRVARAIHIGATTPTVALIAADGTIRQLRAISAPRDVLALREGIAVLTQP